jgi:hypothetical protein
VNEGWSIRVPYTSRDDSLIDVAAAATNLPDDDRVVVQHILLEARLAGDSTAGDLLDRLGRLSAGERRRVLDNAREAGGLPRSEDLDRREAFVRMQQALPPGRDREGRGFATCCHRGCSRAPVDHNGLRVPVTAKRWACPEHAAEGDFDPPDDLEPRVDPRTMTLQPNRAEQARLEAEQQRLREEDRRRHEARRREAEAIRRAEERYREEHRDDPYAFPDIAGIPQERVGRVN